MHDAFVSELRKENISSINALKSQTNIDKEDALRQQHQKLLEEKGGLLFGTDSIDTKLYSLYIYIYIYVWAVSVLVKVSADQCQ